MFKKKQHQKQRKKGSKQKYAAISCSPSLQSIKKGTCVCEVAIVANQITSKSENEPTTSLILCVDRSLLFIRTTLRNGLKEREKQMPSTLTHYVQRKCTYCTLTYLNTRTHWIVLQSFRMCLGRSICLHSSGLMPTNYMSIICLPEHFCQCTRFLYGFFFSAWNLCSSLITVILQMH